MKICVVGSGVVGSATGKGLKKHGHDVIFLDVSEDRVKQLRDEGYEAFTPSQYDGIRTEATMFSVPTPTVDDAIQLDYVADAVAEFGEKLRHHDDYHLVVIRSTVTPGATRDMIIPILEEKSGKKAGEDFGVVMQPEFLRAWMAEADFDRPWIIIIGEYDSRSGEGVAGIYESFDAPIERLSLEEAEAHKYIHNLFNAAKIAIFNEQRLVCNREGWDTDRIFYLVAKSCEAMWNPIYGIRDRGPFSGACLPKDTQAYLAWGVDRGHDLRILEAVVAQNNAYAKLLEASRHKAA